MAPPVGEDYPLHGADLIDLDDYIKNPIFQQANHKNDGCVIDVGSVENRPPVEVKTGPEEFKKYSGTFSNCRVQNRNTYISSPERRCAGDRRTYHATNRSAPYSRKLDGFRSSGEESSFTFQESALSRGNHKQYSLDSGVSDVDRYRRRHRSGCQSDVGWRGRESRGGGPRTRNRKTSHDVADVKSQSSLHDALKQQQEKIDHLTALCEKCLKPKRQRKSSKSRHSSTSELSSSPSEDISPQRRQKESEKMENECEVYKIMMRKLDELNLRLACAQAERDRKSSTESKTGSESVVVVSDKAVCTDTPKNHKPKTVKGRNEARAKLHLPKISTSSVTVPAMSVRRRSTLDYSTDVSRRRSRNPPGYERPEDLEPSVARRMMQMYTAFANTELDHSASKRSGLEQSNIYGIHDYKLNDPISFYNQSKRLGATAPPRQPNDLCALCRAIWSKIRSNNLVCKVLCCGDGFALHDNITKNRK